MSLTSNRRGFLKGAALAVGGLPLLSAARVEAAADDPPANYVRVRQNIADLDPNGPEVQAYRAGVAEMQKRTQNTPNDRTGWEQQARIHLNYCPHGNWFFLPWHRAYLHYFERVCRKASGNPQFMLPYWDWTTHPSLPDAFWGANNPLNHTRDIAPGQEISPEFVGQAVMDSIYGDPNFVTAIGSDPAPEPRPNDNEFRAQSTLEGTPHNNVHVEIGGDMVTFMSPLDPIFWLHHANVDRIWALWDDVHPGQFPSDNNFLNYEFKEFVDENGAPAVMKVAETTSTFGLGYRYPGQKPQGYKPVIVAAEAAGAAPPISASAQSGQVIPADSPLQVEVPRQAALNNRLAALAGPRPAPSGMTLKIDRIEGDINQEYYVRVFLNCDYLTVRTPVTDPHYVASFSFFGQGHGQAHGGDAHGHNHPMPRGFYLNLAPTLARLGKRYPADQNPKIGFVVVPRSKAKSVESPAPKLKIARLNLQAR